LKPLGIIQEYSKKGVSVRLVATGLKPTEIIEESVKKAKNTVDFGEGGFYFPPKPGICSSSTLTISAYLPIPSIYSLSLSFNRVLNLSSMISRGFNPVGVNRTEPLFFADS
jgi:hypothetical protein